MISLKSQPACRATIESMSEALRSRSLAMQAANCGLVSIRPASLFHPRLEMTLPNPLAEATTNGSGNEAAILPRVMDEELKVD